MQYYTVYAHTLRIVQEVTAMSLYSRLHPIAPEIVARCGRTDPHGYHWIGRQDHGGPYCLGNVNVIVERPAWVARTIDRSAPIRATKELPRG